MFKLIHHLFVWILSGKLSIFWRNEISSLLPIVISGTQLFFNYILVKTLQLKDYGVMIVGVIWLYGDHADFYDFFRRHSSWWQKSREKINFFRKRFFWKLWATKVREIPYIIYSNTGLYIVMEDSPWGKKAERRIGEPQRIHVLRIHGETQRIPLENANPRRTPH